MTITMVAQTMMTWIRSRKLKNSKGGINSTLRNKNKSF